MKYVWFVGLLLLLQQATAQDVEKQQRPFLIYAEIGGGFAVPLDKPQYSRYFPVLYSETVNQTEAFYSAQVGLRFLERHHIGLGFEPIAIGNGFIHRNNSGEHGVSFGATYYNTFLQYSFNVLKSERFAFRPLVQLGAGFSDLPREQYEVLQYSSTPFGGNTGPDYVMRAELTQQREVIFIYGIGATFEWEILDDRLAIGATIKLLDSPYYDVRTYEVEYQRDNDPQLDFGTSATISNLHVGAYVRGYF